ncbi:MAG TPA: hypothetical protein VM640_13190 [Desulfitobacterium sp.]|nr:hypothetical protein [Desulfitobacterium sp.]
MNVRKNHQKYILRLPDRPAFISNAAKDVLIMDYCIPSWHTMAVAFFKIFIVSS